MSRKNNPENNIFLTPPTKKLRFRGDLFQNYYEDRIEDIFDGDQPITRNNNGDAAGIGIAKGKGLLIVFFNQIFIGHLRIQGRAQNLNIKMICHNYAL